jgi:hypothetical protein
MGIDTRTGSRVPKPPTYAPPLRRAFHLTVSAAGWVLFFYWWEIVLPEVTRHTVQITVLFLVGSLVIVVGSTQAWAWHNRRLYGKKGPRTQVREADEHYAVDVVGRTVHFEGSREQMQEEPEVEVTFDEGTKTYRTSAVSWADENERKSG